MQMGKRNVQHSYAGEHAEFIVIAVENATMELIIPYSLRHNCRGAIPCLYFALGAFFKKTARSSPDPAA